VANVLAKVTPGDNLMLNTSKGVLRIVIENSADGESLGMLPPYLIYYRSRLSFGPFFDVQLYLTLFWGEVVYSSLALLSMLPLFPFDGDKFLFYVAKRFATTRSREIRIVLNVVFFGIIVGNMILSFIKHGPFLI